VFTSKDFEKSNIGFLMNVWVLSDSVALFWNFFIYRYLQYILDVDIPSHSIITCVLFVYLARIIQQMPLLFQAFISFVNYLSVAYPSKHITFNKKLNLIWSFILIIIFLFVVNIPNSINFFSVSDSNTTTISICKTTYLINIISVSENALVRFFLPFSLITTLNVLNLKASIKSRLNLNVSIDREKRFGIILLILGILFLFFNLPFFCSSLIQIIFQYAYFYPADSIQMINIKFITWCTQAFSWLYYMLGFLINISFNKIFQQRFNNIIRLKFRENHN
jgi:hypothetical protein